MSFKDIRGQDRAVSFLRGSMASGRISHAYIFFGPGGVGKKLTALNFAKALNCRGGCADGSMDSTTDVCVSCRKIDSSNHPDLLVLKPAKAGGSIGIDDIRALIKDVGLKPYEGRKKLYIIDGAQSMSEEASNALLKTLEEPVSDSVIILIIERLGSLLPTIVSRSQVVKFFPLRIDEAKDILVKNYAIDETKAHLLAHLASGRIGEALANNDEEFFAKRDKAIDGLAGGTFFESDFDKLSKAELKTYLDIIITWYRDVLVTKALGVRAPEVVNIDRKEDLFAEAARADFGMLDRMIWQAALTYSFIEQNVNPKLAMAALGTAA